MLKILKICSSFTVKGRLHSNRHPLILYSTNSTVTSFIHKGCRVNPKLDPTVFTNYLISLGFSRQQAEPISVKLAHNWRNKMNNNSNSVPPISSELTLYWKQRGAVTVSDFNFVANAHSVVSYFKHIGSQESHIRIIVWNAPKILLSRVNTILKPKVEVFLNFGMSVDDIALLVYRDPAIFFKGLNSTIVPSLKFLREFMSNTTANDLANHAPFWFTHPYFFKVFKPNMIFLRDYGVPIRLIEEWILISGVYSNLRDTETFKKVVRILVEKLGIRPNYDRFMRIVETTHFISDDIIDSKKQLLKSFGWTESHVATLFRNYPWYLRLSEDALKESLDFLMNTVGYEPNYLVTWPLILSRNVKTELTPKYRVLQILKEKGLLGTDQAFYKAMYLSPEWFEYEFVIPFDDVVRQVYHTHTHS